MPEPKYSPQEFAQILKQKYPQYSDVEDSVLVEKILEKYPQYSNSVDVGLKKKDVGQSIGTGEETSSTDSKSIMFPTPSSSGSENQIPRPVLSQSLSESLNKFAEEVKQDPSQYKEAIERGQNTDLKKILPDVKDEETNKRVAERIKDNFLLGVGELVDAAKTLGYAVGPVYDPTMATINAFDANKRAEDFKETMYQSEKGFIESISEGNFTEAATIGLETTARSAPLMILSAISGGGAGGYLAISTLYAAQTYNESVNQKWFQDMTPVEKAGYSSLIGGLESIGEMAGGKVLRGASKDFMRGLIGKKAFEQTVGEFTRGAFKAVGLGMSEEAIGEFVTGFGQSIVQQTAQQGIENVDIIQSFADGFEGAALGAFSGGLISTVGQAPNAVSMANSIGVKNSKIKNRKAIIDLSAKFEEAQTKEEKTAIAELLDIAIQKDASDVNRSIDLYEVMQKESPEDFNYVHQLDSSLRRKINQYEASTDPQVKKALRSEIVKISELKYEIERKYDSEEEAGTPGPVVEGETPIEGQPIEVPSAEAPETNRVVQAQEALILEALGSDATLTAVENGTEVDQADTEIAQEKILNLIDVVSNSDMAEESKAIYIQTLEDKFDELEYYDNKTITTAEQVTERVPVGAPKRIIKEEVGGEIKRGKLKIYERLENVEVATGGEADGQTSVVEVQDDGALDVVTYDTKTKQEVSRNQKIADSVLGLEYVESIFNKDGNVSGVVLRPFTPKGQDESPLRLEVKDRPDLSLDLAIDARKKQIGTVAPATFEQAYMEVTKTINKKEKAPLKERTVLDKEVAKKEAAPVVKEVIKLRTERSELQKSIAKAERVISKLIPNSGVKIITHETRGDFNKAMAVKSIQGEQKYAIEYGRFIPSKNEIHINLEDSDAEGPLHEAFHAVFLNVFSKGSQTKREQTAKEFESGIKKILNAGTAQDIDLAKEMDRFVEEGGYTAEESPEEFLSQLAGFMGVNYTQLSKPTQSKLIQWINSFIAKFLPSLKIKSSNEFVDFMNSFAAAANEQVETSEESRPLTPSPIEISPELFPEKSSKGAFDTEGTYLANEPKVNIKDLFIAFKAENNRNPNVWIWMSDQLKRGQYVNPETGVTLDLEGGIGFAFDPKNREQNVVWSSGLSQKTLQDRIGKSDFIWFMSGSPLTSFNFSKGTTKAIIAEIEAGLEKFKGKSLEGVRIKDASFEEFVKIADKFLSEEKYKNVKKWEGINSALTKYKSGIIDHPSRMKVAENLLHEGAGKKMQIPIQQFLHQTLGVPTKDVFHSLLRDEALIKNNIANGDLTLLVKPTGIIDNAGLHDTYPHAITGDVIGMPEQIYNVLDVVPEDAKKVISKETGLPLEKPSAPAQIKTAVGDVGRIYESEELSTNSVYGTMIKESSSKQLH
jgi:hypothetical protein